MGVRRVSPEVKAGGITFDRRKILLMGGTAGPTKRVFLFGGGRAEGVVFGHEITDHLGGKGGHLHEMASWGINVPPGFTISTKVGIAYLKEEKIPNGVKGEILENLAKLEEISGKKLGAPDDPLLVSVRSGAKFSMPGMMDSILNLGLNDSSVEGLARKTNNPHFAYDSYRRLMEGFGRIVLGIKDADKKFQGIFDQLKQEEGIAVDPKTDSEVPANVLRDKLIPRYKDLILRETGNSFPADPLIQLDPAIQAVFRSWNSQRAKDYREKKKIPEDLGTACNVQAMVFGNTGPDSGTGVYFTRNNSTGEKEPYGDFLPNAQGDDVVSGKYPTMKVGDLAARDSENFKRLLEIGRVLEEKFKDMQDIEFTIENGQLWILQVRSGKRTGKAAVRIAVDMANEGLITMEQALLRVKPEDLAQLLYPQVDPAAKALEVIAKGAAGSMGASFGGIAFNTQQVLEEKGRGERTILVRVETSPEDFKGMVNSDGIWTARGGETSHAAIVCKSERKVGVFGTEVPIDEEEGVIKLADGRVLRRGDVVTVDATGREFSQKFPQY